MVKADIVEYKPQKTDNQGQSPTCSAHAILGCMRELIEQYHDEDVDFDIIKIFNEVEKNRNPNQSRMFGFMRAGQNGFVTTDGRIAKLIGYKNVDFVADDICEALQTYGPIIIVVRTYKEMDLAPLGDIIEPLPSNPTQNDSSHAMQIIGYDRSTKLFKIQNNWRLARNIKRIGFDALLQILAEAYVVLGVQLIKPQIKTTYMITPICQSDPRWAKTKIGKSNVTIAAKGCTISCICMVLDKLRGSPANPSDAAYFWKFTSDGRIFWNESHFEGAKFIWRGYDANWEKIAEYSMNDSKGIIIAVNNDSHWLYVENFTDGTINIIDPIDGQRYAGLPDKYKISGYALFEKV